MGKGSSPAGTTNTVNPTQAAQLPFLQSGWQNAQNLYNQQPNITPALTQAYQDYANTGQSINETLRPVTNTTYNTALTGGYGVQNSPAYPYLNQFAAGTSAPQQALQGYGAQAAAGGGPGLDELAKAASGAYVGQNPYAAAALQVAQGATTRGYQTATAPQTDANFAGAGRYGSGALLGARGQNEQNLGATLANQANTFYNTQYQQERQLQDQAAQQYQQLRNAGLGLGIGAAGADLSGQQAGAGALQSGYQSGNAAALTGLQASPQILQEQLLPAQAGITAGTGLLGSQWAPLNASLNAFGQPTSGSSSQPYFQNQGANALSALTGVAGLGNTLAGGGGLSSLFGGAAGGIGAFGPELSGGAAESLLAAPGAAFLDASGGTGLATLASAAPAAGKSAASAAPLALAAL